MSVFADSRKRLVARWGRPMTLRCLAAGPRAAGTVPLTGWFRAYAPNQITGAITQGDAEIQITNTEIAATAWPGPPRKGDSMLIDTARWQVLGATPVTYNAETIGWNLWVRGG